MAEPDLTSDDRACAAAIRAGSRSFHAASLLLPSKVRRDALALYAFCRMSDDLVDAPDGAGSAADRLSVRLDAIYGGRPHAHYADRAFARVVREHAIPKAVPDALIEGFRWDEAGRAYATIDELNGYGARVASTVGVMMTLIMGRREPAVLARACDLGLAMQLTNIARDVGEDARNGRVYLPIDWLSEAGADPRQLLADPAPSPAVRAVTARLLSEADRLYDRARTGIGGLPRGCRPAIGAALGIYREIGRVVAANGHDSVTRRARTTGWRKLDLAARSMRHLVDGGTVDAAPTEPAARFLVDAVRGD